MSKTSIISSAIFFDMAKKFDKLFFIQLLSQLKLTGITNRLLSDHESSNNDRYFNVCFGSCIFHSIFIHSDVQHDLGFASIMSLIYTSDSSIPSICYLLLYIVFLNVCLLYDVFIEGDINGVRFLI